MMNISLRLQPLINLDNQEILGYELLSKPVSQKKINGLCDQVQFNFLRADIMINILFDKTNFDKRNKLFVNFSSVELSNVELVKSIKDTLKRFNFPEKNLIVEISEESSLRFTESVNGNTRSLLNTNFQVALDDYGVNGFVTQEALETSEFSIIKLDKSFLRESSDIFKTVRNLNKAVSRLKADRTRIVLEGIETEADLACAIGSGIDIGQGYFLGMPDEIWRGKMQTDTDKDK